MRRLILKWIFFAAAIYFSAKITALFMEGFTVIEIKTFEDAWRLLLGAGALALINLTLGRVIKFFTLPLTCLTLGLFTLVVNAAMLMLAGRLELGFQVDAFLPALVGSTVIAVVNSVLGILVPDEKKKD